jgi:hypothetical protein
MPDTLVLPSTSPVITSAVVEFRPYVTRPGRRDDFNALFERLVPDLEAAGQHIHGQFRVANDPDKLVWLRGYDGMEQRGRALPAFYDGPAWKAHRDAVNATLADIGDVRLLKPVDEPAFTLANRMTAFMVATIYVLNAAVDDGFLRFYRESLKPTLAAAGAPPVAALSTDYSKDNFPRIPIVRAGEHAFVWFAAYGSADEYRLHQKILGESKAWSAVQAELATKLASPPQTLELVPTAYSLARHGTQYRYSTAITGDVHDFDFLDGKWTMVNRRLVKRGVGSNDWDTFPATVTAHVLMGGVTNVDEVVFPTKGWSGTTFRHFDLEKRQWSIYWVNTRDGKMQSPVVGGFYGDVGLFYGEDTDEGRPIKVVYKWTRVGPDGARWEQAFSYDDGKTWETNWVNEHRRVK